VVADSVRLLFADFPARYEGPERDVWRVDDQGEFSPQAFRILFLAPLGRSYTMGLTWAGTEGEDSYLLVADSADGFRTVATVYRYWAPK